MLRAGGGGRGWGGDWGSVRGVSDRCGGGGGGCGRGGGDGALAVEFKKSSSVLNTSHLHHLKEREREEGC